MKEWRLRGEEEEEGRRFRLRGGKIKRDREAERQKIEDRR
jgi:hypothetical protein